jgi:DNA-binding IclR family transcriptional regulator
MRPTSREAQILEKFVNIREFRVNDITKFLGVSRQQANNFLRELIEKGRIEKHGTTKRVFIESCSMSEAGLVLPPPYITSKRAVYKQISI